MADAGWLISVQRTDHHDVALWRVSVLTPEDHALRSMCPVSKERAIGAARQLAAALGLVERPEIDPDAEVFFEPAPEAR